MIDKYSFACFRVKHLMTKHHQYLIVYFGNIGIRSWTHT